MEGGAESDQPGGFRSVGDLKKSGLHFHDDAYR